MGNEITISEMTSDREQFGQLQKIADHVFNQGRLKTAAIASLVFGPIGLITGLGSLEVSTLNYVPAVLGALLIIQGIWLLVAPRPIGFIFDGLLLIAIGCWNIFQNIYERYQVMLIEDKGGVVLNAPVGASKTLWLYLGIIAIISGFYSFRCYRRFAKTYKLKISPAIKDEIKQILDDIQYANAKEEEDIIEFRVKGFSANLVLKGRLYDSGVLFYVDKAGVLFMKSSDVQAVGKDQISLETKRKALIGKTLHIKARIGGKKMKATMKPEYMSRYEAWKNG